MLYRRDISAFFEIIDFGGNVMTTYYGIPGSEGIAVGKALIYRSMPFTIPKGRVTAESIPQEQKKLRSAVEIVRSALQQRTKALSEELGSNEAEIFEAHLSVLDDPEVVGTAQDIIATEKLSAAAAIWKTCQSIAEDFRQMDDEYFSARAADILDVGEQIVRELTGEKNVSLSHLDGPCIVISRDITPSETASMDKKNVLALVCEMGSRTSHAVILSRSLGIPAVVGAKDISIATNDGEMVIVNGKTGEVTTGADEVAVSAALKAHESELILKKRMKQSALLAAVTSDGVVKKVEGNIGRPEDAVAVSENGGDGIGLFRSEFFYMDSTDFPTEEAQYQGYCCALEIMGDRPVIVRTMDIGGDKKLPYFALEQELNPFLGYRALRISLDRKDIFKPQLRALLRAALHGNLSIMLPMVSCTEEIVIAKDIIKECKQELLHENLPFCADVPIGIMIEIPSIALQARDAAKLVDFFSIGTNDLIQYCIAADRMNQNVSGLYTTFHPGVLRLISNVITEAHKVGIPVGLCGEMAGEILSIPVLLGLGLDHFSMSASRIPAAKHLVRSLSEKDCQEIAMKVIDQPNSIMAEQTARDWILSKPELASIYNG